MVYPDTPVSYTHLDVYKRQTLQNIQNTNKTLKVNELGVVASYTFGGRCV